MRFLLPFVGALVAFATPALSDQHPDEQRFEYMIKDFQGAEPDIHERIKWECWDDTAKLSISCSFIRGSLRKFRHVYRYRGVPPLDPSNLCDLLHLDMQKLLYENILYLDKVSPQNDCEDVTHYRISLVVERKKLVLEQRRHAAKCGRYAEEEVARSRKEVAFIEERLENSKEFCAMDKRQEARQRERVRQRAEREARAKSGSTQDTGMSWAIDYSLFHSDGKIDCFGGCQSLPVSPRGPYSTITSSAWGDKGPAEINPRSKSAR